MDPAVQMNQARQGLMKLGGGIMKSGTAIDPDDVPEQNLKMVICGDQRVGKTKLFQRLISDKYTEGYYMTIGSDYETCVRILPGAKVNLEVWDTAGHPQYRSILPIFFNNADIVAVIYDVTDSKTFDLVDFFVTYARRWVGGDCDVCIFGTKIDSWKFPRQVELDVAVNTASRLGCRHFETSAVTTQGLEGAIRKMINRALKRKRLLPEWLVSTPREDVLQDGSDDGN
jgi:small GTP-binding protein